MFSEDHRAAVALKAVRSIWNVHEKLLKPRGIDVHKTNREWTEKQRQRLPCPGARTDFGELCGAGCAAPVLMGVMVLLGQSPRMEKSWRTMMVTRRKRQHYSGTLTKAADILRSAFEEYISLEDDRLKTIFGAFNRTPISRLVEELRIYGEFFDVSLGSTRTFLR
jgi:hypothetical protein